MGDLPINDVRSAADEALAILKTENMTDIQRKAEMEVFLDRLSAESFNSLTILAQQLADYSPEDEYRGEKLEEDVQVNVEFDEENVDEEDEEADIVKMPDEEDIEADYGREEDIEEPILKPKTTELEDEEVQIDTTSGLKNPIRSRGRM